MREYHVLWTYIANYSEKPIIIRAATAEAAIQSVLECYSEDFRRKAKVYAFEGAPQGTYDGRKATVPV